MPAQAAAQSETGQPQPAGNQAPPQAAPTQSDPTIVVTGERSAVQSSIDRISYSIVNDLQGVTGSMADVLRNVPSVTVDPAGNVSMRGDPGVSIMIDGRPSGMLEGSNRGIALLQLPASEFERVEVITNPSAAFGPEGAGVINLIRKRVRRPGLSGSARLSAGARGRVNGGVSGAYAAGGTTLSGDLSARRDELSGTSDRLRHRLDPESGRFLEARQELDSVTETRSGRFRTELEQSLGSSTDISVEFARSRVRTDTESVEMHEAEIASAVGIAAHVRNYTNRGEVDNREIGGRLTRSFGGDGDHKVTIDASHERSSSDQILRSTTSATLPVPDQVTEEFRFAVAEQQSQFKVDYERPTGDESELKLGYQFERQENAYDNSGARGPTEQALLPLPDFTNRFRYDQTVNALYGTYQRPFGRLTALVGLRLEQVDLKLDQVTTGIRHSSDYFRVYPTLHLTYELTDKEQLRASYSRRVQRPRASDLNPFLELRDPFNVRSGNPELDPQVTDSAELAWQRRADSNFYQATLYYRNTRDAFTNIVRDIGNGVLLTTRENLGAERNLGLELVANRRFGSTLTVNASADVSWEEIEFQRLGLPKRRSGVQFGGRASVTWQPTDKDYFQVSGFLSGKSIRPQGHREPSGMINAGYRRKVSDSLSLVATVRDLIGNFGETVVYDTPTLRDRAERRFGGRVIFVGLTYTFGGNPGSRRDRAFDFEAGRSE